MNNNYTSEGEQPGFDTSLRPGIRYILSYRMVNLMLAASLFWIIAVSCSSGSAVEQCLPFVVSYNNSGTVEPEYVYINADRLPDSFRTEDLHAVRDLADNKLIDPEFISSGANHQPEYIRFRAELKQDEPLRAFCLISDDIKRESKKYITGVPEKDSLTVVKFLQNHDNFIAAGNQVNSWAELIANSFITTYPDPVDLEIFSPDEWTYTNAFFLNSLCYFGQLTGKDQYLNYVKRWFDHFINEEGKIDPGKYTREEYRLDDILPGRSLLYLYEKTGELKYLNAANELIGQLENQPRTSEGGFWHKQIYDWQMWLDGVYMADVFLLQYARQLGKPEYCDEAIRQIKLVYSHTYNSETGLLYHGWDESKSKIWADPVTGASPEIWGRGLSWYMMALIDALDYIPDEHPGRAEVLKIFQDLSVVLKNFQDKESGLWYQVIDKADRDDNWPESSCTAMFAYSYLKGVRMGYLEKEYEHLALKAFEGMKKHFIFFDDDQRIYLTGTVKVGTLNTDYSDGSYNYYVSVDRRINDFKGVSALLYLAIADEFLHTD